MDSEMGFEMQRMPLPDDAAEQTYLNDLVAMLKSRDVLYLCAASFRCQLVIGNVSRVRITGTHEPKSFIVRDGKRVYA